MDWISPVSGVVGAVVGASASAITAVRVLKAQLSDARTARADAERARIVASLAALLGGLEDQVRLVPERTRPPRGEDAGAFLRRQRETEEQWKEVWLGKLRPVKTGVLEVKDEELRGRLLAGLRYSSSLSMLEYATHHHGRRWVLGGLVDDMTYSLFAWSRGDANLPEPNKAFEEAKESYEIKTEEWEMVAQAEEEERQRRRSLGSQDGT